MNPGIFVKAAVTPVLIGTSTWAGRRWGDAVGGWLVGLPLTSGPVVLFVSVEHGSSFGAATAAGVLAGCLSQTAFALAYSVASLRAGPALSLLSGSAAFAALTVVLGRAAPPLPAALLVVVAGLLVGIKLLPDGRADRPPSSAPVWDIPLRGAATMTQP